MISVLDEGFLAFFSCCEKHNNPPSSLAILSSSSLHSGRKEKGPLCTRCLWCCCAMTQIWDWWCRRSSAGQNLTCNNVLGQHDLSKIHSCLAANLPLFLSDFLALWGCSHCCFQIPCWDQPAFWHSAHRVTSRHDHIRLLGHLSQSFALCSLHAHACSEMTRTSDNNLSQLQEIVERYKWNV